MLLVFIMSMNGSVSEAGCKGKHFLLTSKSFSKNFSKIFFSPFLRCPGGLLAGLARKGCKGSNFFRISKQRAKKIPDFFRAGTPGRYTYYINMGKRIKKMAGKVRPPLKKQISFS
ncbi:MAG: hypothetical protein IJG54_07140 [Bacteroidales bacterium]|nr:hypothetical protein [Bacteroidales bacterium]